MKPSTSGIWQSEIITSNGAVVLDAARSADTADTASLTVVGLMCQLASISSRMRRFVALSSTTSTRSPSSALGFVTGARRPAAWGWSKVASKKNVLPRPSVLSTQRWPPMSSTSRKAIARPSPVPP